MAKLDFIKIKNVLSVKRLLRIWKYMVHTGRNFINHIFYKRRISRIYKELSNLNIKKWKNLIRKLAKDMKHITIDNINMSNEHLKRYSVYWLLGKCKLKLQWGITADLLDWLK